MAYVAVVVARTPFMIVAWHGIVNFDEFFGVPVEALLLSSERGAVER